MRKLIALVFVFVSAAQAQLPKSGVMQSLGVGVLNVGNKHDTDHVILLRPEVLKEVTPIVMLPAESGTLARTVDVAPVFNVKAFGAKGNGTNEDSIAVKSAFAAAILSGGGTVYFPAGSYLISSQITIPREAGSPGKQKRIKIIGEGGYNNGYGYPPFGGTQLVLNYTGKYKVYTSGLGVLELEDLTLTSTAANDSATFVYTTNTTLYVDKCSFVGSASLKNDAIMMGGGDGTWVSDSTENAMFAGYGSVINGNWFNNVRRGIFVRSAGNAISVTNNFWMIGCAGECAIEILGNSYEHSYGGYFAGNNIEMTQYKYGIKLTRGIEYNFMANSFYDFRSVSIAAYYFDSQSYRNVVTLSTYGGISTPVIDDAKVNTVIGGAFMSLSGPLFFADDGVKNIGSPTGNRPANIYLKNDLHTPGDLYPRGIYADDEVVVGIGNRLRINGTNKRITFSSPGFSILDSTYGRLFLQQGWDVTHGQFAMLSPAGEVQTSLGSFYCGDWDGLSFWKGTTKKWSVDNSGNMWIGGAFTPTTVIGKAYTEAQITAADTANERDYSNSKYVPKNGASFTNVVALPSNYFHTLAGLKWFWSDGADIYMFAGDNLYINNKANTANIFTLSGGGNLSILGSFTCLGGNSTLWNTAVGWGNHASAGYAQNSTVPHWRGNLSSAPGSPAEGDMYFDTSLAKLGVYTGGTWRYFPM